MIIGGYTLLENPEEYPDIIPQKSTATLNTYGGAAFFSFGLFTAGQILSYKWPYMSVTDFDAINTIYQSDLPVLFDPEDGRGETYSVEIISPFDGKYFVDPSQDQEYRKDVTLLLFIVEVL